MHHASVWIQSGSKIDSLSLNIGRGEGLRKESRPTLIEENVIAIGKPSEQLVLLEALQCSSNVALNMNLVGSRSIGLSRHQFGVVQSFGIFVTVLRRNDAKTATT